MTSKVRQYIEYLYAATTGTLVKFPTGYCCDACKIAFSNFQARNYHVWKTHPGCVEYRKETFWDYLFDSEETNGKKHGCYHSCVCSKNLEKQCHECQRNVGIYR